MKYKAIQPFLLHIAVFNNWFLCAWVQAGVFALRARLVFDGKKLVVNERCYEQWPT
jgi:hypothetical protein